MNENAKSTISFRAKTRPSFISGRTGRLALAALGCTALIGTGMTMAYLTDTDSATNSFTVVSALDVDLSEPLWDKLPDTNNNNIPDAAEKMVPGQSVTKDPTITNNSETSAWVFMTVEVPAYDVNTVNDDGSAIKAEMTTDLFTYTINENWTQIGKPYFSVENNSVTRTYAYKSILPVNQSTPALFSAVTLANLADNQLDALATNNIASFDIPVKAYAIQSHGFDNYTAAWNAYTTQNS